MRFKPFGTRRVRKQRPSVYARARLRTMVSTWRFWTLSSKCAILVPKDQSDEPLANYSDRDWKKLTFYYFADNYINFNSLVTDLFKMYKTRIWMSAINPASFVSPPLGQTPSGVGPGAVGVDRSAPGERRQNPQQQPQEPQSTIPASAAAARPFSQASAAPYSNDRGAATPLSQPTAFSYAYSGFNNVPRPVAPSFTPNVEPYATTFSTADYTQQRARGGFPLSQIAAPRNEQAISPLTGQNDWVNSFQSMSLNGNGNGR